MDSLLHNEHILCKHWEGVVRPLVNRNDSIGRGSHVSLGWFSCESPILIGIWMMLVLLRPVYTGDFWRSNSMQFLRRESCNLKIARVNQVRFSVRFVAAISQGFRTCLKLDATSARQKLHRVAATKIACVNGPLGGRKIGEPGEKPSKQGENQEQTQSIYDTGPVSISSLVTVSNPFLIISATL